MVSASYWLYGLRVASDVALPVLQRTRNDSPEVAIRRTRLAHAPEQRTDDGLIQYALDDSRWLLHYRDAGTFCIEGTDTILVDPLPQASPERMVQRLLGSVFGLLLRRRGLLVLHANAVARGGVATLLLGASGAGKSTLSGALCRRGYRLLSDDLGVIEVTEDGCFVRVGVPRLKLRRDSEAVLRAPEAAPPAWSSSFRKYIGALEAATPAVSVPVSAFYVLEEGAAIALDELTPREALLALIRHAHLPRSLGVTGCAAQHFHLAGQAVHKASLYRLVRGASLSTLPVLVHTVEIHRVHTAPFGV